MRDTNTAYLLGMHGDPWEIEPSRMKAYLETLIVSDMSPEEIEERTGPRSVRTHKAVAVLPITGPITKRASLFAAFFGGTSTDKFGEAFDSLVANDDIGGIVFDIDSPGGTVEGTMELAEKIYKARGAKPIVAVANGWAASAAYKLASAADQVVVIPSGQVGSIGTRALHLDYSAAMEKAGVKPTIIYAGEYKAEFDPYMPLSEEAQAEMQRVVDVYYADFVKAVARNRGVTATKVKKDFGGGRMLMAKEAVEAGLADKVGTLEDVIAKLGGNLADRDRVRAENEARALEVAMLAAEASGVQTVVPGNPPSGSGEGVEGAWRKLRLSDFTEGQWEDLPDSEQSKIKRHFAWHPADVSTFADLKLGHHFPPGHANAGKASLNGVQNALARLGQTQGVGGERERVRAHLRAHLAS